MHKLCFLLALSIHFNAIANELVEYDSIEMSPTPEMLNQKITSHFKEHSLEALLHSKHGAPSLGINQVFVESPQRFVTIKYGIEGRFVPNQVIQNKQDFIVHFKNSESNLVLLFRGFKKHEVLEHIEGISQLIASRTFKFPSLFVNEANAANCDSGTINSEGVQSTASVMTGKLLLNCIKGVGEGIWSSTGGMVVGLSKELFAFAKHPIDYSVKVADKIENFMTAAVQFTGTLLTDPNKAFDLIGAKLGSAWTKIKSTVAAMSAEMKINFVCSLIGSIGTDAAIAMFTGGTTSAKVLMYLEKIATKFEKVGSLIKLLGKLNAKVMSSVKLTGAKMEKFMKQLMKDHFPDEDLLQIESFIKNSESSGLKTLSCYIH